MIVLKTPQRQEAGKIAVILRPTALAELMGFMAYFMNRRQADEGLSPFSGKIDTQFFGEKFTMQSRIDDKETKR